MDPPLESKPAGVEIATKRHKRHGEVDNRTLPRNHKSSAAEAGVTGLVKISDEQIFSDESNQWAQRI